MISKKSVSNVLIIILSSLLFLLLVQSNVYAAIKIVEPSRYLNVYNNGYYNQEEIKINIFLGTDDIYSRPINLKSNEQETTALETSRKTILPRIDNFVLVVNGKIQTREERLKNEIILDESGYYVIEIRNVKFNDGKLELIKGIKPLEVIKFTLDTKDSIKRIYKDKIYYYEQFSSVNGVGNSFMNRMLMDFPSYYFPEVNNLPEGILSPSYNNNIYNNFGIVRLFDSGTTYADIKNVEESFTLKTNRYDENSEDENKGLVKITLKSMYDPDEKIRWNNEYEKLVGFEEYSDPVFVDIGSDIYKNIMGKKFVDSSNVVNLYLLRGLVKDLRSEDSSIYDFQKDAITGNYNYEVNFSEEPLQIKDRFLTQEEIQTKIGSNSHYRQGKFTIRIKNYGNDGMVERKFFEKNEFVIERDLIYYRTTGNFAPSFNTSVKVNKDSLKYESGDVFYNSGYDEKTGKSYYERDYNGFINGEIAQGSPSNILGSEIFRFVDIKTEMKLLGYDKTFINHYIEYDRYKVLVPGENDMLKSGKKELVFEIKRKRSNVLIEERYEFNISDIIKPKIIYKNKTLVVNSSKRANFNILNYVKIFDDYNKRSELEIETKIISDYDDLTNIKIIVKDRAGNETEETLTVKWVENKEFTGFKKVLYNFGLFIRRMIKVEVK